jgi:hypothetical protein
VCDPAGVPHLLQNKWHAVAAELQAAVQLAPFSNRVIRLCSEDEATVAPLLERMAGEWGGEIAIGSYPVGGVDSWAIALSQWEWLPLATISSLSLSTLP